MANTTRGIPYPDDYSDAADVPATLQSLAATVDTLIGSVDTKATNAGTAAASAATAASNAASAVAGHTHNGSGSANIAMTAVTGLSGALGGKADTGHTHAQYAAATHTHSSAELAAHTHADYSPAAHTHLQAQSHGSADTDSSTAAIHHTLGIGANQAAPGNHVHSGYADTSHTHSGYAATAHNHDTAYATTGHTHNGFATTSHNHDTAYATASHGHNGFATTSHGHTSLSELDISQTFVASSSGSNRAFRVGSDGRVYAYGIDGSTTDNAANVRVGASAQLLKSTSTIRVKEEVIPLSNEIAGVPYLKLARDTASVDPYDVLLVSPAEYKSLCPADDNHRSLGFIAEDVAEKFPWAAEWDDLGDPSAVRDRPILAALLCVVQDQQKRISALEAQLGI